MSRLSRRNEVTIFKVRKFPQGKSDKEEGQYENVEAASMKEAAEKFCGRPLRAGPKES